MPAVYILPDLFLQIPVFASLILLCVPSANSRPFVFVLAGFCLGCALGLKLSAIIYIPAFAFIFLARLIAGNMKWLNIFCFASGVMLGFLLLYAWWGIMLYQKFGNPFFPFFNEWFKSPEYDQVAMVNHRFMSESIIEQLLLPFRVALSDIFTYIEMRQPDIRPGVFVVSILILLGCFIFRRESISLRRQESEFLGFLVVLLYTWVLMSGNGRYAIGLFCFFGAGIFIALRAFLPLKVFRSVFLLVMLLQWGVLIQAFSLSSSPFRFRDTAWGGSWFNIDFSDVLGDGNQLVLTGTRNSYSVFVKDVGKNTSVINVHGLFALDMNPVIQEYLDKYNNNIVGMILANPTLQADAVMLERVYFQEFGRFGLKIRDAKSCQYVEKLEGDGTVKGGFVFCPLIKAPEMVNKYSEAVNSARTYFNNLEALCPHVFSPTMYAVTLSGDIKQKYYANYELDVSINSVGQVIAKKEWSMVLFQLGSESEMRSISREAWQKKYCEPIRHARAMPQE